MHALRCGDVEFAALTDHRLRLIGPHAGGVDYLRRLDLELLAALLVAHHGSGNALPLAEKADDAGPVRDVRTVRGCRTHKRGDEAGVVHLRVVVLDSTHERVLPQRRSDA